MQLLSIQVKSVCMMMIPSFWLGQVVRFMMASSFNFHVSSKHLFVVVVL